MEKTYNEILKNIFDIVKLEKANGNRPKLLLMPENEFELFTNSNMSNYRFYSNSKYLGAGLYICGILLKIHKCSTVNNIEIY